MTPLLLAALVLGALALPPGNPSLGEVSSGRSYSNNYEPNSYGSNNYLVSSHHLVSDTAPTYSDPYASKDTSGYGSNNGYNEKSNPNDYSISKSNEYTYSLPTVAAQPQYNKYSSNYGQDRFHPTTYEEEQHTGEVLLPPADNKPAASQDSVVSVSTQGDLQDSFLQSTNSFGPDTAAQSSDPVSIQVAPSVGQGQHYDYPLPTPPPLPSGYDYHPPAPPPPPPPAPAPYYYYPPPSPPTNLYLPAPTDPPPPPPPPPQEERQVDYTYYYLGPKLWYVPLFFSIYFVLYVGALIIKAVTKHKILFPQQLYNAATTVYTGRTGQEPLDMLTAKVTRALTTAALKYFRRRVLPPH